MKSNLEAMVQQKGADVRAGRQDGYVSVKNLVERSLLRLPA